MTTETETITITITPNSDGLYQAFIGGEPCGTARKGVGEAARVAAMSLGAAETKLNSGHDGVELDQAGLAIIMKAMLSVCVEHLQKQLDAATLEQRLAGGMRVKKLMAAKRIPVDGLMTAVLETLLSMRMVSPPTALSDDAALAAEVQSMFGAAAKSSTTPTKSEHVKQPGRSIKFAVFHRGGLVDTLSFSQDAIKIGRLKGSHICLDDEAVARMHAVIEVSGDEVRVIDLGSATGTYLNSVHVNKRATISDGDSLNFGPYRLDVSFVDGG